MEDGGFKYSFARYSAFAGISFFVGLIFFAHPARSADITELGSAGAPWPPVGNVLSADGGPYLVDDTLTVETYQNITFEPGVIIKLTSGSQLLVRGVLNVSGEDGNPVVFTSYRDDEYGGDTNNDGFESYPPPAGSWNRVGVYGTLDMDYAIVRYGGSRGSFGGMIELYPGSHSEINNSIIEYAENGIYMKGTTLKPSTLLASDSIFRYNSIRGIDVSGDSSVSFSDNVFNDNSRGMRVHSIVDVADFVIHYNSFHSNSEFGFEFVGSGTLDITNNWWGDSSGPFHPSLNPGGDGDAIGGSGSVLFSPWTSVDPSLPPNNAPVLSYISDEGYVSDGVEPNVVFVGSDTPVFQVVFSDEDGDSAQYVRLVVGDVSYAMATSASSIFSFTPSAGIFGKGEYEYHFEAGDGVSSARLPDEGELGFEVRFVPVVLVPGIMGTELWKAGFKIWPNIGEMILGGDDEFMNVLTMDSDGYAADNQVIIGDVVRTAPTKDIFEGLINEFEDSGYSENTDLFVFPYDWRLDIRTSAQSLKQKIDLVLIQTSSQKVDIVAHSMGGLLSKQYILDNSHDLIDKLIFVGTPHLGAANAAKTLLFGDDLGIALVFSALSPNRIKYIAQNMPAIYELLPSREYINQSSYYYYDHTQSDIFDFDRTNQLLVDSGLNSILLSNADSFHSSSMDNFDTTGIDMYNINGCTTPTITTIMKRGADEYSVLLYEGDGTVPLASSKAINVGSSKEFYFKNQGFLSSIFPRINHSEMPSTSGIKELITQIITESDISLPDYATQDSSECIISGKLVSVHSPVNLHIYDSEGNHVGRGENGDIEYNISGVSYEEIGENKFVFLPESGGAEYRVELDGTDSGTFSLRVAKVENNEITETAYYSDIPVNSSSEATITLSDNVSSTVLQVDEVGAGNFEMVSVASVLNSEQSSDIIRPITSISTAGGTNSATFSLSATDDNSGILKTEYSLDSGSTWLNYSNPVIINAIGNTEVLFRSKDKAGNLEEYQSQAIRVSPAAVILMPLMSRQDTSLTDRHSDRAYPRAEESRELELEQEVLGVEVERPKRERYSDEDILAAFRDSDIETLLDYLGQKRDLILEQIISTKYGNGLLLNQGAINFISYGTKSTISLGEGERAGVIHSFYEAFNRLPQTNDDWNDVIRISTNKVPIQYSAEAEQRARSIKFPRLYSGEGQSLPRVFRGGEGFDEQSIMMIAYGIRPKERDMEKEVQGIAEFVKQYSRIPESTLDWNILRSISY